MKIAGNVEALEIKTPGNAMWLTLAWDNGTSPSLVLIDTGLPGQTDVIRAAIARAGFRAENLTHIIITHEDMDHIGSCRELLSLAPGAKLLAHTLEAPAITGKKPPSKLLALLENYESLPPEKKSWCERTQKNYANFTAPVSQTLEDGEILPLCGGIEVIHTPGHTPGHICLFLRESRILVTGDAINIREGSLAGPNPQHTLAMEEALASMEKALRFPVDAVVSYHGGYLRLKN